MLTLRCFGSATVRDDTTAEDLPLRSRKHLGLLLYLACHPKTLHTREELAMLLWDDTGSRERHSLSQALYDIRSKLGPVLEADTTTIQFRPDRLRCEAQQFEDAVERGDHETALELFRGEFAPNLIHLGSETFDRWLDGERERHRVLAILALRNAQRTAEERGDWDRSCLAALRLIRLNDFDEKSHRALMRGLWMKGDAASALAHYEALKTRQPSAVSHRTAELAERIRVLGPRSASEGRPLVGRDHEFGILYDALHESSKGHPGLVVIAGEPGVGKSHLSYVFSQYAASRGVQVAHPRFELPYPDHARNHPRPPPARGLAQRNPPMFLHVAENYEAAEPAIENLLRARAPNVRALLLVEIGLDEASAFTRLIEGKRSLRIRRITVKGLSPAELAAIVRHRFPRLSPELTADAVSLAGGNPGYAIALAEVGALGDKVDVNADTIRLMFEDRLSTLSAQQLSVLVILAALGGDVSSVVAGRLCAGPTADHELRELRKTGLVECVDGKWRFCHLGLFRHLETKTTPRRGQALHLAAAKLLLRQSNRDHLGIARHLERGGYTRRAYDYAIRVAERCETLTEMMSRATESVEAARIAYSCARTRKERFRAQLAEAAGELSVGRYETAGILFGKIAFAEGASDADRFEALAGQAEAAIGRAAWNEAACAFRDGAALRRVIAEPTVRGEADLRLGVLRLRLRYASARESLVRGAASELEQLLHRYVPERTWHQRRVWADAWLAMLAHLLAAESTSAARAFVAKHTGNVASLGDEFRPAALMARGAIAVRSGELAPAVELCRRALRSPAVPSPSRLRSTLLNNLGVALLERGDFEAALTTLGDSLSVGKSFGATAVDMVHSGLNLAMCQFYAGQLTQAAEGCESILPICDEAGLVGLSAEGSACLGLMALEAGKVDRAQEACAALPMTPTILRFDEDPFKITWLQAGTDYVSGGREAVEQLTMAAEQCRDRDVLGHLKLRFIATLMTDSGRHRRTEAQKDLTHMGIGWFARRATAWWHAVARARMHT